MSWQLRITATARPSSPASSFMSSGFDVVTARQQSAIRLTSRISPASCDK